MEEELIEKKKNVFSNKNFTLTFLGALVSNIASLFYSFAVSFYILKITDNNAFLQGIYLAVSGITYGVVTLFGGVISDRFNKAKIMYICDYLKGIVIFVFTLLIMFLVKTSSGQLVLLFVVAVISNAIAGIFTPASSALLPQIVESDLFQQAESYFSILNSFQAIVGVILAGLLYTLIPTNILFMIVAICYILSGVSEMFIRYNSESEKQEEKLTMKIVFTDIKDTVKYILTLKSALALIICTLFVNFFFSPIFDNFLPYFISTDVSNSSYIFKESLSPEMWNSFFSMAFGIGSLIMGIIISNMKQKEKYSPLMRLSILSMSLIIVVVTLFYFLFTKNIVGINALLFVFIGCFLMIGITLILFNIPASTTMMLIIDKDKFGKVSSVMNIGSQGLIPLATFLGGIAITFVGSIGFLIICSLGLLFVSLILFFNKSIKEL